MYALIDGDVLVYMSMWEAETKEQARENFDSLFESIIEELFTEGYAMAMGGQSNFRTELYPEYKVNRAKSKSTRPEWYHDLKSDIVNDYEGCVYTENCEADDLVSIWAYQKKKAKQPYIVVSVDKDLDCIPGKHYNPRKKQIYEITPQQASLFFYKQLLMGDPVDNIPGVKGVGPKTAEKLLKDAKSSHHALSIVCCEYMKKFSEIDEAYDNLMINGKLLYLMKDYNDYFNLEKKQFEDLLEFNV